MSSEDELALGNVKRLRNSRMLKKHLDEDSSSEAGGGDSSEESPTNNVKAARKKLQPSTNSDDDDDSDDSDEDSSKPLIATKRRTSSGRGRSKAKVKAKAKMIKPTKRSSKSIGSRAAKTRVSMSLSRKRKPTAKAKNVPRGTVKKEKRVKVKEEFSDEGNEFERGDARKHFKEGQTKICPPVGDGCRAFYESLLQENPHSLISIRWCIERGCLMGSQQKEVYARYTELRELGAYKLSSGGVKPEFANGVKNKAEADSAKVKSEPKRKARK